MYTYARFIKLLNLQVVALASLAQPLVLFEL